MDLNITWVHNNSGYSRDMQMCLSDDEPTSQLDAAYIGPKTKSIPLSTPRLFHRCKNLQTMAEQFGYKVGASIMDNRPSSAHLSILKLSSIPLWRH